MPLDRVLCHRLFDGERFRAEPLTIELRDGRIQALRATRPDDVAASNTLDARSGTVLPGLIDAHTHIARAGQFEALEPPNPRAMLDNLARTVAGGVTTVGDMGCTAPLIASLRQTTREHPCAGPRIRASGPLLADPMGYPFDWLGPVHRKLGAALPCDSERAARDAVRRVAEAGMDHVKLTIMHLSYQRLPLSVFTRSVARALVDEAHALGLRAFAHAHSDADYNLALDAGVDALMHSAFDPLPDETIRRVADAGISVCPTLYVFHSACLGAEERWDRDPDRRRGVDPAVLRSWKRWGEAWAASGAVTPEGIGGGVLKTDAKDAIRTSIANLLLLRDAGVPFAYGSDGPYGFSVLGRPADELELWVQAGLTRQDALRAATAGAARLLGITDTGRIAPGLRADLVIVDDDPRETFEGLRSPRVIREGHPFEPARLHGGLSVLRGLLSTLADGLRHARPRT